MEQVSDKTDVKVAARIIRDVLKQYTFVFLLIVFSMNDVKIVITGLISLWVIGINSKNKDKLMELGAGKCVILSMQNHSKNSEVLFAALKMTKNLGGNLYQFVKKVRKLVFFICLGCCK